MARQFIVPMIGGFSTGLPDTARATIAARWPGLDLDAIDREFFWYRLIKDAVKKQGQAAAIRKRYDRFQQGIKTLLADATWFNQNNLGSMIGQTAPAECHDALPDLIKSLEILNAVLPHARKHLPEGHQVTAQTHLGCMIAPAIEKAGLVPDKRPNGPLCGLLGILLTASDEHVSNGNLVKIAEATVDLLEKMRKK